MKTQEEKWQEVLKEIPQLQQRQDSLFNQMLDLRQVAVKLGMYDAVDDVLNRFLNKEKK